MTAEARYIEPIDASWKPYWHPTLLPRRMLGLWRYLSLRLRFRRFRVQRFYIDRGHDIRVGPDAEIHFGRNIVILRDFSGAFYGRLRVGDGVFLNRGCSIVCLESVAIGDNSIFGEGVSIHDENHIAGPGRDPIGKRGFSVAPVVIGSNVWIGAKATILPGVTIGDNAVVGANAVVSRDIPAGAVALGVPARVHRFIQGGSERPGGKKAVDNAAVDEAAGHEPAAVVGWR